MSEIAESITTPLTHEECATMARAIAADETNWRPHVKHDPGTRHYARIERNDDYEVYVICWMDDHDTGFHDHDVSAGGVHVIEGGIFRFDGESDAMIVNGLMAVLRRLYNGLPVDEVLGVDARAELGRLGLTDHLSAQRSNGLRAMIERIREVAAAG